jgi:hypothetical protein
VLPVKTDVSEERIVSIIKVTRIGELGTTLAATSNRSMLRNIPQDSILLSSQISRFFRLHPCLYS